MSLSLKNKLVLLAIIMPAVMFVSMSVGNASTIQLAKGTSIKVRFAAGLEISSGEWDEGDPIPIVLDQPIDKNGRIIVKAGAKGAAEVIEVKKAGRGGKGGYIKIEFVSLQPKGAFRLSEGDAIGLITDEPVEAEGNGKGLFPWLFLKFILKGSEAKILPGEVYETKLSESVMMTDG